MYNWYLGVLPLFNKCSKRVKLRSWNETWSNKHQQCAMLKCVFDLDYLPCDYAYGGHDVTCDAGLRLPVSRNLEEVYLTELLYPDYGTDWLAFRNQMVNVNGTPLGFSICYQPNKLRIVQTSFKQLYVFNKYPYNTAYYQKLRVSGLESLETLFLNNSGSILGLIINLFTSGPLPNLRHVSLRGSDVTLPPDFELCSKLKHLVSVDLSQIALDAFPVNMFRNCDVLSMVNLSRNTIRVIPHQVHEWIDAHDVTIDLSFNPLQCHCHDDVIATLKWMQKHQHKYTGFLDYSCFGLHNKPDGRTLIADIDVDDFMDQCTGWLPGEIVLLCLLSSLTPILTLVLLILTHKYRYRLVMVLYRIKRAITMNQSLSRLTMKYDVFLSYCFEDNVWVHNLLIPELEDMHGLRCCVHYRDFPIRGDIADAIQRHMAQSRCIIIVLSAQSVSKHWPVYELKHAQNLSLMHGKKVFYIKLGDLGNDIKLDVKQVLDRRIYLEWPEGVRDTRKIDHFYERLVAGIRGQDLCASCSCCQPRVSNNRFVLDDNVTEDDVDEHEV